ncbi:MAG: ISAs1 family transposase [Micromonosporaceae bacterium]
MGSGHASRPTENPDRLRPLPRQHPPAAQHAVTPPESRDAGKLARPVRGGAARKRPASRAPRRAAYSTPGLYAQLAALPWRQVPLACQTRERGHGRAERRTLKITAVAAGLAFPHAARAIQITRRRKPPGKKKWSRETVYAITSLTATQASPAELAAIIRGHWLIEDRLHWVRDLDFDEDRSQVRTASAPRVMATLRNLALTILRLAGHASIAAALRHHARRPDRPLRTIMNC